MQGRTNVKDGIALNATISEMEVESGNVVAGNFVEYKEITNIEDDNKFTFFKCQEEIIGNYKVHKYFNYSANIEVLELYSLTTGELLDTKTFTPTASSSNENNGAIAVRNGNIIYAYNAGRSYVLLRIANDSFSIIDTFEESTTLFTFCTLCFIDDTHLFSSLKISK